MAIAFKTIATRREFECRLTRDRALETLADAQAFLEDRGLLTLMPDCALPSLFGACHEEPYSGTGGFGNWPKTKYPWAFQLPGVASRLHRGKTLYLSDRVALLAAPLCLAELAAADEGEHGVDERRLVRHLAEAGPSATEELKEELGLDAKAFKRARDRLERVGAILGRPLRVELPDGGHRHTSEYRRWDVGSPGDPGRALQDLLVAGVRAAVVAPEREALRWFTWRVRTDAFEDERLVRLEDGWVTAA